MTGWKWEQAGVRRDPQERERRARRWADQLARRPPEVDERRRAYTRWRDGLVVPHLITLVLDRAGLDGPDVDALCGAREPEVDQWEAGERYPTWDQLCALAKLTRVTPSFFTWTDLAPPEPMWLTSMWYHVPAAERRAYERCYREPITRYPRAVLDERPLSPETMPE